MILGLLDFRVETVVKYFVTLLCEYGLNERREESPGYFDSVLSLYSNLLCYLSMVSNYSLFNLTLVS